MAEEDFQFLFKIILIGDTAVGKTNLLTRFERNEFNRNSKPTIGVDFYSKTTTIDESLIKAQIWDTAGQERYKAFSSAYYNGAHGVIIVYDITKKESFNNVINWLNEIKAHLSEENIVVMLIGNKSDLVENREIMPEEGESMARENGMFFCETSAQENYNDMVGKAFNIVIEEIYKNSPDRLEGTEHEVSNNKTKSTVHKSKAKKKETKKSGCC